MLDDDELEEVCVYAEKYKNSYLCVEFCIQLTARGSTINIAKKKWAEVHNDMKCEKDLLYELKLWDII